MYEFDPVASTYMSKCYEFPTEVPSRDRVCHRHWDFSSGSHLHRSAVCVVEQCHVLKSWELSRQSGIIPSEGSVPFLPPSAKVAFHEL